MRLKMITQEYVPVGQKTWSELKSTTANEIGKYLWESTETHNSKIEQCISKVKDLMKIMLF